MTGLETKTGLEYYFLISNLKTCSKECGCKSNDIHWVSDLVTWVHITRLQIVICAWLLLLHAS